jgi:hypothetical protein
LGRSCSSQVKIQPPLLFQTWRKLKSMQLPCDLPDSQHKEWTWAMIITHTITWSYFWQTKTSLNSWTSLPK